MQNQPSIPAFKQDTYEYNKYVPVILEVLLWSEMVPPMVFIMLFCCKVIFLHSVWELINNLGRNSQGRRMCVRSSSSDNCQKTDLKKISLQMSGQKTHDRGILGSLAFCLWEGFEFCFTQPGRSNITYSNTVLAH